MIIRYVRAEEARYGGMRLIDMVLEVDVWIVGSGYSYGCRSLYRRYHFLWMSS